MDKLTEVSHEFLLMDKGREELLEHESAIEKASLSLSFEITHLTYCMAKDSKPTISSGMILLEIDVPTYKGKIIEWQNF